jgi:Protein of unknown function (DUF4230)
MYKIIPLLVFLFLLGCTAKISDRERKEIFAFREMGDLTTVEYTLSKVVKATDHGTWFKLGQRKIIMSVVAYAKAGIDMESIKEENIFLKNGAITIQLPHAKLISLNIPPEEIKEELTETGFWRDGFKTEEKNNLLIQAEQSVRKSIDSLGILAKAEENARFLITNYVKRLGYKEVAITFDYLPTDSTKQIKQ